MSLGRRVGVVHHFTLPRLDLSTSSYLWFLTGLLAGHWQVIGSRWRRLCCAQQALLVLAHLPGGGTYPRLAGFRIGVATVYQYVREAVDLLAALAPDLPTATRWPPARRM